MTAELVQQRYKIACKIERWGKSRVAGSFPLQMDSSRKLAVHLAEDDQSLVWDKDVLTPEEAAEKLLVKALSKRKSI